MKLVVRVTLDMMVLLAVTVLLDQRETAVSLATPALLGPLVLLELLATWVHRARMEIVERLVPLVLPVLPVLLVFVVLKVQLVLEEIRVRLERLESEA